MFAAVAAEDRGAMFRRVITQSGTYSALVNLSPYGRDAARRRSPRMVGVCCRRPCLGGAAIRSL